MVEELEGDIESIAASIEHSMENAMEDFRRMDNDVSEKINKLNEEFSNDETPIKRNRKAPETYEPSFKNKIYTSINDENIKVDEVTFTQVLNKVFQQMSLKAGIKKYGERAIDGMTKELRQMHMRDSFISRKKSELTLSEWRSRCEAVNLIKEKKSGEIKGRCCADGRNQRAYITKEESASPTAATEAVILTSLIEAKEERKVITLDIPNAFIQTYLEDKNERIILVLRDVTVELLIAVAPEVYTKEYVHHERGEKVLYLECTNVIYGTIKAALLFYIKFKKDIEAKGFKLNPYDRCVANKIINGKQMTVLWHVDDLKASHAEKKVLDEFVEYLQGIYDDEEIGTIKVNEGPVYEFVGMKLDFSKKGKLRVNMIDYVKKIIEEFNYDLSERKIKTPAADHLFQTNEDAGKLNKKMKEDYHTFVAKSLFLCKRGRPDIQTAVAFLTTRVQEPDVDDWKKLVRMLSYLKYTAELILTLKADDFNIASWFIDASYAVHPDMKGHTGAGMTLGKGAVYSRSTKQKINTKSSTESELVGVDDILPQILWTNQFMRAQGWGMKETIVYQDNKSAILLENNGRLSSSSRTKHINTRFFFVKDCIERKELTIKFLGTNEMWSDFYTKPLQGKKFIEFRDKILNLGK